MSTAKRREPGPEANAEGCPKSYIIFYILTGVNSQKINQPDSHFY